MKFNVSIINVGLVLVLLVFVGTLVILTFTNDEPANVYECKGQKVPYRANITDCLSIEAYPSDSEVQDLLLSPQVNGVLILLDPNGTAGLALSATEIHKMLTSLRVTSGVVYTYQWELQPNVPNMSIEQANYENPIIWLKLNQSKSRIEVSDSQIIVYAKNQYDLDSASCKISLLLMKKALDC